MANGVRILLAFRNPRILSVLRETLDARLPGMHLVGVVDPTIETALAEWHRHADVILVGGEELLLLWRRRSERTRLLQLEARVIALVNERQMLDVVSLFEKRPKLLFDRGDGRLVADGIVLAIDDYLLLPEDVLRRLTENRLRLEIVEGLSDTEKRVLSCLGRAMSNLRIAKATDLPESRVSTVVRAVTRKLRMKNRTMVALFAASALDRDSRI